MPSSRCHRRVATVSTLQGTNAWVDSPRVTKRLAGSGAERKVRVPSAVSGILGGLATAAAAPFIAVSVAWIFRVLTTDETVASSGYSGFVLLAVLSSALMLVPYMAVGLLLGIVKQPTKMLWLSPGGCVLLSAALSTHDHVAVVLIYGVFGAGAGGLFVLFENLARFPRSDLSGGGRPRRSRPRSALAGRR